IQAAKGMQFADAFTAATERGSAVHDPITVREGHFSRTRNRAGGLEGGMTNGEDVLVDVAFKPISTLMKPLPSADLRTGAPSPAHVERSDVCVVPAAGVVAEAMLAFVLADGLLEKFGADTGGGTPLRPANRARMRELGLIVGLRASVARITKGIAATLEKRPTRPESAAERAKHAVNDPERKAAYTDVDVTFDVEHASADAAATAIVNWLASGRGLRVDIGKEKPYPMVIRAGAVDALGAHLVERGWSGRIALVSERNAAWHLAER